MLVYRFESNETPVSRSFFTEIIASISDVKFAKDGRHILSRDYMTLKVLFLIEMNCFFLSLYFSQKSLLKAINAI